MKRILLLVLFAVGVSGCVAVKPYQRSYLSKEKMQFDPDPQAVLLEQHVFAYREGAIGGYGGGGGGCGCN